jgi:hypothetical protein
MSKIIQIISFLVLILTITSCEDDFLDLTNPNAVSANGYLNTEDEVLLAVNGIYQSLRSSDCIGENSSLYTDERSDDGGRNDNQSNAGEPFQFNDFSLLPSNTYLKRHWLALYESINRCNYVLSNIEQVTFANGDLKDQYIAEAKFLRALIYFHLVRKWGDIPLVTKSLLNLDEVQANTYREKQDIVYEQIVTDLKDALNSVLPNLQTVSEKGRTCKAAINALLGEVYLTMANTLDPANKTAHLNNAKTYLLAAYNMKTFDKLSDIPYADVFDVSKKSTNPEIIFQIVYKQGDLDYSSSIAANAQAKGETINSLKPSSGSGMRAGLDLVKDFEEGDPRKDFTVKYASASTVKDWFVSKYRDTSTAAGVNGYGGNDWILMRYADVVLMLSEVYMYLNENSSSIAYLNMVRERANMPDYETSVTDPVYKTKYPTLQLAILHERRIELAFEHKRWYDLIRTFKAQELVNFFQTKNQADYGTAKLSNISTKDRYYPIPFDEYKLDPEKMYQNPGY